MMKTFIGNNLWPEDARKALLHIYPQTHEHSQAGIWGSPKALLRLSAALAEAAAGEQGSSVTISMMGADGEGYPIKIFPMSDRQMDVSPSPYVDTYRSE